MWVLFLLAVLATAYVIAKVLFRGGDSKVTVAPENETVALEGLQVSVSVLH